MPDQPNVLFLITDQLSREALEISGNKHASMPHLDTLARSGTFFHRAYCTAPVCGPARSSLYTGCMPHQTGVVHNGLREDPLLPNLCELFCEGGYDVAWAGPWHLDTPPVVTTRFDHGAFQPLDIPPARPRLGAQIDGPTADAAIDYLRSRLPRERPFFLTVPLTNPHDICYWVMNRADDSDPDGPLPPLPDSFSDARVPDFVERCRRRTYYGQENSFTLHWKRERWREYLREYYALGTLVDAEVGRILSALEELGLSDSTLVVHTADHGEGMARHGWVVKLMYYESVVGVPLTLRLPGVIPAGLEDHAHLISGDDLLPTLLDYAGIARPDHMTGRSLRNRIEDSTVGGREFVVIQLHPDTEDLAFGARILITHRYKYVALSHGDRNGQELLFDLEEDPDELCDLSSDDAHTRVVDEHRQQLRTWMAEHADDFALPL
ncbi:MAG: sulfatase-like hydrolase/transferase [Candidatus Latescibacterota bacterium]|nr:sulfatase-like hydrolase/transferase [Candidatus Latescibacterota bacterium]